MSNPLEDQGSPRRWLFFILVAGLVAITFLYLVSRIFEHSGPELLGSPYSVSTRNWSVSLGAVELMVPENTIRQADHRTNGEHKQLDLIFLWPQMEGFSREKQLGFSNVSETSNLVHVTLSNPVQLIKSSDRLYSVYSEYFTGDPIKGPEKLIGFAMAKNSGFEGEVIYFKPDSTVPFVARCVKANKVSPAFCLRELSLAGKLQVSYRFRPQLLKDWPNLDKRLLIRLENYLR